MKPYGICTSMIFKNEKYTQETLLGMLDLAIESMSENSICCHCTRFSEKTESICSDSDLCKASIFDGLSKKFNQKK